MRACLLLVAVVVSACGGSSSETPWPVEPDDVNLGPSGETPGPEGAPAPSPTTSGKGVVVPSPTR